MGKLRKDANGRIIVPTYSRSRQSKITAAVAEALRNVLGSDAVHIGCTSDRSNPRLWVPSSCAEINDLISRGKGWPIGRIVECFGAEATVKTGFGYDVIAAIQKMGGIGVLLPTEGNIDEWLAKRWGVDINSWITPDVATLEDVDATIMSTLDVVGRKTPIAFVWDSVAGTSTKAELDEPELKKDRMVQLRAALMSKMFRRFGAVFPEYNAILFCINQVRDNPDAMFGDKDKPTGGRALPFYSCVRMRLSMTGKVTRTVAGKKHVMGFKVKAYTKKNRISPPFQEVEVLCDFEKGLISVPDKQSRPKKKTKLQAAAARQRK